MKLAVTSCAVSAAAPARAAIVAEAIAVGLLPPHRREWNRRPYSAILAGPLTLSVRKNWKNTPVCICCKLTHLQRLLALCFWLIAD